MKTEKDDGIDDLFKKGLKDPVNEPAFRDADWDAMEQMLDAPKKRSVVMFWLPIAGGIAAMLLVFLGYLYFKPGAEKPDKHEQVATTHHPKTIAPKEENPGTSGGPIRQAADSSKRNTKAAEYANNPGKPQRGKKGKSFFTLSGKGRRKTTGTGINNSAANNSAANALAQNKDIKNAPSATTDQQVMANNNTLKDRKNIGTADGRKNIGITDDRKNIGTADDHKNPVNAGIKKDSSTANTLATTGDHKNLGTADENKNMGSVGDSKNPEVNAANATSQSALASSTVPATTPSSPAAKVKGLSKSGRTVYAMTVLASSDLNGVNSSFQQSKVGGNFGALFSATFNKKWTFSTGAQYDIKPYLTNFNNYHTVYHFKEEPSSVNANCRMLEIPVFVNYKVYSMRNNRITLGTGLSSYFMLREDYSFNYPQYETGPSSYTVINKNRNILSVLNFDATYEHQINSKVGITFQPYYKLPLTDVGYSQVRLQSSGVAVGLNWYLNASSKPK